MTDKGSLEKNIKVEPFIRSKISNNNLQGRNYVSDKKNKNKKTFFHTL